ncbi:FAD-dependent monooxygenase [Kitasatospora griseola]|uniref:FAD-dependent monooxygenase n=1 Tax=Kitasatospora griseola TaxID=2064 RepID=UPI0037FEFDFF
MTLRTVATAARRALPLGGRRHGGPGHRPVGRGCAGGRAAAHIPRARAVSAASSAASRSSTQRAGPGGGGEDGAGEGGADPRVAGPAGLMLAHLLGRAGVEAVALDTRTRHEIETTQRAGILEADAARDLVETGVGDRILREGHEHTGVELRFGGRAHRIDFQGLVGASTWLYPQTDVFVDLADARERDGGAVHFGVRDTEVLDVDTAALTEAGRDLLRTADGGQPPGHRRPAAAPRRRRPRHPPHPAAPPRRTHVLTAPGQSAQISRTARSGSCSTRGPAHHRMVARSSA